MKRCKKCREWRKPYEFPGYLTASDPLIGWCLDCRKGTKEEKQTMRFTTKEEFKERIEARRTVKYGCCSFFKWGAEYRLRYPRGKSDATKTFENFEAFWNVASRHLELQLDITTPREQRIKTNNLPVSAQWGERRRCVMCSAWKWPAEYDEYSSLVTDAGNWCRDCMSRRDISPRGEECIRLAHHDLGYCHTQKEVAEELGISEATVSNELAKVREVAPQLFPLLTELEAECCDCYANEGMIQRDIATYLTSLKYLGPIKTNNVAQAIKRARGKGAICERGKCPIKTLCFDDLWLNERIKGGCDLHDNAGVINDGEISDNDIHSSETSDGDIVRRF